MIVKALIADDSPIMRKIVRANLEKANVKLIKESKNGEETMATLKQGEVNLLFLDLNMPEPNGWEILDKLHKGGKTSELSVIIISNEMGEGSRENLRKMGVVGFIPKPFNIQAFQEVAIPIVESIHNEEKKERLFDTQREEELITLFANETPLCSIEGGYLSFEFKESVVKIEKKELAKMAILEKKIL